jgi:hypothetical protein
MPKNIKIDNMTFDGNSDMNWEDFIKVNNGGDDEEDDNTTKNQQNEDTTNKQSES